MRGLGGQEQKFWYIILHVKLFNAVSLYLLPWYAVPTYMYLASYEEVATIASGLHAELPNSSLIR